MAKKKHAESEPLDQADAEGVVDIDEQAEVFPGAQPIAYFGTDFDVHGLVRRINSGDIIIPSFDPQVETGSDLVGFQRRFVWRKFQMDRFVESLLLGYPVPGIFLVQQADKKLLVLDGQQRLRTLQAFYRGTIGKDSVFKLESVDEAFKDAMYTDLDDEDRRTLDNTFIHATIVKYDAEKEGDQAVYQVFERLNTGGTNLYPHEIRVALYNGKLVRLIRDMNQNSNWRDLYGNPSDRLKDQELILRFVALYYAAEKYKRPLKGFLNSFVKDHRDLEGIDAKAVATTFQNTCALILQTLGRSAFRLKNQLNAALVDSVLYGIAKRLDRGKIQQRSEVKSAFASLVHDEDFIGAIARATADEERVATRLGKAKLAFSKLR